MKMKTILNGIEENSILNSKAAAPKVYHQYLMQNTNFISMNYTIVYPS